MMIFLGNLVASTLLFLLISEPIAAWSSLLPRSDAPKFRWSKSSICRQHVVLRAEVASRDSLAGVTEFEEWFSQVPGSDINPSISHEVFGSLRGLAIKTAAKGSVMSVPRSVVLQSDMNNSDWDAQLAKKLWKECKASASSPLYGYCALLTNTWVTKNSVDVPPSCAPNALRHWNDDQKHLLTTKPAGQRLLELCQKQESQWRRKFDEVEGMSWEQFEWAMEVVHSRAFSGEFGIGASFVSPIISTITPAIAAVTGAIYYFQFHGQDDLVLLVLAAIAAVPTLFNALSQSPQVAVLLPFIDSANHKEDADSKIDYSPLSDAFTLSIGPQCLTDEGDGKKQLYISYGVKGDTELLLNYGFLEGVRLTGDDADMDRQTLGEAFLARN